jgi:hypothetical protein
MQIAYSSSSWWVNRRGPMVNEAQWAKLNREDHPESYSQKTILNKLASNLVQRVRIGMTKPRILQVW